MGEPKNILTPHPGRVGIFVSPRLRPQPVRGEGDSLGSLLCARQRLKKGSPEGEHLIAKAKAGQVTEVVTVTAQGERVETESSDLQARLTADQISLISTKGRDITSLLRLIPGTSNDDDIEAAAPSPNMPR